MFFDHLLYGQQPDYLTDIDPSLMTVRQRAIARVNDQLAQYQQLFTEPDGFVSSYGDYSRPVVTIGSPTELTDRQRHQLFQHCRTLMPWKKGPYRLFGIDIDSEWRSDYKWQRIAKKLGNLKEQKVADIGCHNGYFMFRLANTGAKLIVGFDPNFRWYFKFHFLQRFAQLPQVYYEPFGVEHLDLYTNFFDIVLCLGVLYHQTDPITILRKIHNSLTTGGRLVVDCQGIAGDDDLVLVPRQKYAGASGQWYLPTRSALGNWLARTNFRQIEVFYDAPLSTDEQRATDWARIASLKDFIDGQQTIEGYPAPRRFYVVAQR